MDELWSEQSNSDFPWIFHRTEFDVLEDEFDGVFRRHDAAVADPRVYAMEEAVIEEQTETEERFERDLEVILAEEIDHFHPERFVNQFDEPAFSPGEPVSLIDELSIPGTADVLYRRAYPWASRLFRWTEKWYFLKKVKNRDMFRVHANVYLVPAKLSFAGAEESRDDPVAICVARKEYELASIYLRRVLQSLAQLSRSGQFCGNADIAAWLTEGRDLLTDIEARRRRLNDAVSFINPQL